MPGLEKRYALRDSQWEQIRQLGLPGDSQHVGVTAKDNRLFVEAVLYRFRAGIPWRDLPPRFGNWHRVYVRFDRWSRHDIWLKIFEQLSQDANNEYASIDSTIVRAHRSAAGAREKGALQTGPTEPTSQTAPSKPLKPPRNVKPSDAVAAG